MKEILDIKQLSTYLQVSISEIRKLVRQKNIIILGTKLLICDIIVADG